MECSCLLDQEEQGQLFAEVKFSDSATPGAVDAVERALRDALVRFVQQARPWYAGISDDFSGHGTVPTDEAQVVNQHVAREQSDQVLRCYSWVTYCPAHLADAVGGAEVLEASGALWAVTPMPGGLLLQATEHLRDYTGAAVHRVRDALAPVLRDKPATKPPWPGGWLRLRHLRVAWDDGTCGPFGPPPTREEWARFLEEATGKRLS